MQTVAIFKNIMQSFQQNKSQALQRLKNQVIYKVKLIIHLIEDVPTDVEKMNFKTYQANRKKEDERNTVAICPKSGGNIIL